MYQSIAEKQVVSTPVMIPVHAGAQVVLHAIRDYDGFLLDTNLVTGRALVWLWDDVLDGGCGRLMWVDLCALQVVR